MRAQIFILFVSGESLTFIYDTRVKDAEILVTDTTYVWDCGEDQPEYVVQKRNVAYQMTTPLG